MPGLQLLPLLRENQQGGKITPPLHRLGLEQLSKVFARYCSQGHLFRKLSTNYFQSTYGEVYF